MATSPFTVLRARLKTIIDTEFAAEGIVAQNDRLHESLGVDGPVAGIFPDASRTLDDNVQVRTYGVVVQVFNRWDKRIDPKQVVDPATIEEWSERFMRACEANSTYVGDAHDWFFQVGDIEFPDDPTGNKSRFLAEVTGVAQNPAVVETTG